MKKEKKEKKSLGVNFIFSFLKTMMGVVFPLITFPYTTRVLGPEYLGKINYAQANMTYFSLLAAFGISSYAVREGARIRDDKEKLTSFAGEMLAINVITLTVSYALCFLFMLIPKMESYRGLMLIFAITFLLTAVGVEWLYKIYEDYVYITVRAFVFQIISVVLLFTCIKGEQDYFKYALILVFSSVGSNVLNLFRSRRYIRLNLNFNRGIVRHIRPMFYIFAINMASSIYLIMDKSMLGYMTNDTEVGLYAAAIQITNVVKAVTESVWMIMTPRVSYLMKNDKENADNLNYTTAKIILLLSIPCAVGMICLSDRALLIFAGKSYLAATSVLRVLMVQLIIASMNGFIVNQLFITNRKDKWGSTAVILGAVVDLVMNAITIPRWGMMGATVSTCLAELAIFISSYIVGKSIFDYKKLFGQMVQSLAGAATIVVVYVVIVRIITNDILVILTTVVFGAAAYFLVLLLMKNELVQMGFTELKAKLRKA